MFMTSKSHFKCGLVRPKRNFPLSSRTSRMSADPGKSVTFGLGGHDFNFAWQILEEVMNCVYRHFLRRFSCLYFITLCNHVLLHCWPPDRRSQAFGVCFQDCSLCGDFSWCPKFFDNNTNFRRWNWKYLKLSHTVMVLSSVSSKPVDKLLNKSLEYSTSILLPLSQYQFLHTYKKQ